jgi:hypothetical protein
VPQYLKDSVCFKYMEGFLALKKGWYEYEKPRFAYFKVYKNCTDTGSWKGKDLQLSLQ